MVDLFQRERCNFMPPEEPGPVAWANLQVPIHVCNKTRKIIIPFAERPVRSTVRESNQTPRVTMKKLILTTAVLFLGAAAIQAQELRRADVPVEAAPQKQATHKEGVMEKANSLKALHGRLHEAIQVIDKQMASVGKEEQIRLSQEKEQLTPSVRAVEQSLTEVSSATDANMAEVMARAEAVEKRGTELLAGGR